MATPAPIHISAALDGDTVLVTADCFWPIVFMSLPHCMAGAQYEGGRYRVQRNMWATVHAQLLEPTLPGTPPIVLTVDPGVAAWTVQEAVTVECLGVAAPDRLERAEALMQKHGPSLRPYQREGVRWLASMRAGLLCDGMGLGKTVQALVALPEGVGCIIVCPASLREYWQQQVSYWRPDLWPIIIEGKDSFRYPNASIKQTQAHLHFQSECLILSSASLTDTPGLPSGPTYLIADEAHAFKGDPEKTQRAKRMLTLCDAIRNNGGWTIGVTATPLLNEPAELYRICQVFGVNRKAWDNWPAFVRLFGGYADEWGGMRWSRLPPPEARERFNRVCLRRLQRDVLPDLPPLSYKEIPITLPRSLCRDLDKIESRIGPELKEWEWHNLLPDFTHYSQVRSDIAALKYVAAAEWCKEAEDAEEAALVFSSHRFAIDGIAKRKGWDAITGDTPPNQRQGIVDKFEADGLCGLAMTIRSGGVGFNLTNASQVLFIDRDYSPSLNAQAIARAWRSGQKNPVLVTDLVSNHPLERRVYKILRAKQDLIDRV